MIAEIRFRDTSLQLNNQEAFISDYYTIQYLKSYFDATSRDTSLCYCKPCSGWLLIYLNGLSFRHCITVCVFISLSSGAMLYKESQDKGREVRRSLKLVPSRTTHGLSAEPAEMEHPSRTHKPCLTVEEVEKLNTLPVLET